MRCESCIESSVAEIQKGTTYKTEKLSCRGSIESLKEIGLDSARSTGPTFSVREKV